MSNSSLVVKFKWKTWRFLRNSDLQFSLILLINYSQSMKLTLNWTLNLVCPGMKFIFITWIRRKYGRHTWYLYDLNDTISSSSTWIFRSTIPEYIICQISNSNYVNLRFMKIKVRVSEISEFQGMEYFGLIRVFASTWDGSLIHIRYFIR